MCISIVIVIGATETMPTPKTPNTDILCPPSCTCFQPGRIAMCSGNITEIPKVPLYVRTLMCWPCNIPHITRRQLAVLVPNNLSALFLRNASVLMIDPDAFMDLRYLAQLGLSFNYFLNASSLQMSLGSLQRQSLTSLYFDSMPLLTEYLPYSIFKHLSGRHIGYLTIFSASLSVIKQGTFIGLDLLESLDLRKNELTACDMGLLVLKYLMVLNLSGNKIKICNFENIPQSIVAIDLSSNRITNVAPFCGSNRTRILPSLQIVI